MKKYSLLTTVVLLCFIYTACDGSGGGGSGDDDNADANDATSLGATLTLSSVVDWRYDPGATTWVGISGTAFVRNFILVDESDGTSYDTDINDGAVDGSDEEINIEYSGSPNVYASSGWTGISTSDDSVEITTAYVETTTVGVETVKDGVAYLYYNEDSELLQVYYYLYATGEVILDGTYVDTDVTPNETHIYDNIRFFEGWNQIIRETTDSETFQYKTGSISGGQWTHIDNPQS